jgi:SAM-dependent methyltransferase
MINFILEDNQACANEMNAFFDNVSSIYETIPYYAKLYSIYGDLCVYPANIMVPVINKNLLDDVNGMLQIEGGLGLDIACGTGMFTRGIAYTASKVYGIDISWKMLNRAYEYTKFYNLKNISLLRASAEALPFKEDIFDGISCCGALHLFPDLDNVLMEMSRVLKEGGKIAVMTYIRRGFLSIESLNQFFKTERGVQFFEIKELENLIKKNGFGEFKYKLYGSIIIYEAIKT